MNRRKIMILVEHDIVARHFLMSGVFAPVAKYFDLCFVLPVAGDKRFTIDPAQLDLPGQVVRIPVDANRQVLFKRLFYARQLRWRPGSNYKALRQVRRSMLGWKSAVILSVLGLPGILPIYRKVSERRLVKRPPEALEQVIEKFSPDVLVHPSVLDGNFINDVVDQGRRRGIPTVVAMNSWDNPSSKSAAVGNPDWLLVWGPQSQAHAGEFMKLTADRAINFGAAQFDVFRDRRRVDRAEFCRQHDADPAKPLVLYAGSSKDVDEFGQLSEIDAAVNDGRLPPLTVIYRPHPWGNGGRDGERFQTHAFRNVRVERSMQDYIDRIAKGGNRIALPDYRDTHDALSNVDAVVSPLSTMLIEATMHGKPALCHLPVDEADARHFWLVLPMIHVKELIEHPSIAIAWGRDELLDKISALVATALDPATAAKMKDASAYFVSQFDQSWGERFAAFVTDKVLPQQSMSAAAE